MKSKKENKTVSKIEKRKRFKSAYGRYVKFLENSGIPFEVEYTHGRRTVKSELGTQSFVRGNISKKGMNFIKVIKNKILKSGVVEKIPKKTQKELGLQYMQFNKKYIGTEFKKGKIIELDLNSAYWDAAYKLGVIAKDDYFKGLSYGKVERLASLGTLAKYSKRRVFDGKKYHKSELVDGSENTRHVWFAISNEVDQVMQKCLKALKDEAVFYWVDALFFMNNKENKEKLKKIIDKSGFKFKTIKIDNVKLMEERVIVLSKDKGELIDKNTGLPMRFFCYDINNESLFI
jgi:hypothetical protein